MNIVKLLQESLGNVKSHPVVLVPILAATVLIALFSLILVGTLVPQFGPMSSEVVISPEEAVGAAGAAIGRMIAVMVFGSIVGLLAHGMTVLMADDAIQGREVHLKTAWQQVRVRLVPLVITSVVVGALVSVGMVLLVLPGIVIAFFLMFSFVALMVRELAPFSALGNSFRTVKSNFASTFVFFLVMIALGVLVGVVNFVIGLIPILGAIIAVVVSSAYASFLSVFVVSVYRGLTDSEVPPAPEV